MKTVSEWIEAGHLESGFALFMVVAEERPKAIAIKCQKYNQAANLFDTQAWFPKSQCTPVVNDYYEENKGQTGYLIPNWLLGKKREDGYEI